MFKTMGAPSPGRAALMLIAAAAAQALSAPAWAQSASGTLSAFQPHFGSSSLSSLEQPFSASTNANLALTSGLVGTYPQTGSASTPTSGAADTYSGVGGDGAPSTSGGYPAWTRQNSNDGSANTALNGKVNLNGGQ